MSKVEIEEGRSTSTGGRSRSEKICLTVPERDEWQSPHFRWQENTARESILFSQVEKFALLLLVASGDRPRAAAPPWPSSGKFLFLFLIKIINMIKSCQAENLSR